MHLSRPFFSNMLKGPLLHSKLLNISEISNPMATDSPTTLPISLFKRNSKIRELLTPLSFQTKILVMLQISSKLERILTPNTSLLKFSTGLSLNFQTTYFGPFFSFYPTETTRTLFNILLNKKRDSIIAGDFGLTRNIAYYLLWHLSSTITLFKMKEDPNILSPYINLQFFQQIPKFLYYDLRQQSQQQVISHLQAQCPKYPQEKIKNRSDLKSLCQELTKVYENRNIRPFHILTVTQYEPVIFLREVSRSKLPQQTKWNKSNIDFSKPSREKVYISHLDKIFQLCNFFLRIINKFIVSIDHYHQNKKNCEDSNRFVNFSRLYFMKQLRNVFQLRWDIQSVR